MRIATWNINGVKARQGLLLKWLEEVSPDIVCLQEIKTVDEGFPRLEIEALGYNVETHRPEELERRRDPLQAPLRRGQSRPAGRRHATSSRG